MESLGKEKDLDGKVVHQGIAVYGNKGSTDQHAYVQQLRDGVPNFFVTFIEVRKDRRARRFEVEPGVTSGDYLQGFPARDARRALRRRARIDHTQHSGSGCVSRRRADRALRTRGRILRLAREHQRLSPARRGSGKESRDANSAIAARRCSRALSATGQTAEEIAQAIDADPEDVYHVLRIWRRTNRDRCERRRSGDGKFFADRVALPCLIA